MKYAPRGMTPMEAIAKESDENHGSLIPTLVFTEGEVIKGRDLRGANSYMDYYDEGYEDDSTQLQDQTSSLIYRMATTLAYTDDNGRRHDSLVDDNARKNIPGIISETRPYYYRKLTRKLKKEILKEIKSVECGFELIRTFEETIQKSTGIFFEVDPDLIG